MVAAIQQKLKFVSHPYQRRVGLVPMAIALALAWTLAASVLAIAMGSMHLFPLILAAFGLATYLTHRWIKDSQQGYELFIDGDLLTLSVYDRKKNTRVNQQISLKDVTTAEYYEPRDTASLLLRSENKSLEIPLWSFGPQAEKKIVSYVRSWGVQVIGIPNDIVI